MMNILLIQALMRTCIHINLTSPKTTDANYKSFTYVSINNHIYTILIYCIILVLVHLHAPSRIKACNRVVWDEMSHCILHLKNYVAWTALLLSVPLHAASSASLRPLSAAVFFTNMDGIYLDYTNSGWSLHQFRTMESAISLTHLIM